MQRLEFHTWDLVEAADLCLRNDFIKRDLLARTYDYPRQGTHEPFSLEAERSTSRIKSSPAARAFLCDCGSCEICPSSDVYQFEMAYRRRR